ncbi:hypothetical protein [Mesorhizobium sp. ISC15]|uniref:hypothetical protein n=1 Tax=Mesorhizobium sp. ISC15 TaxID=3076429 RepID=UPI00301C5B41
MDEPTFETKLQRLRECIQNVGPYNVWGSLAHAYAACMSSDELSKAALQTIADEMPVHGVVRNRLVKAAIDAGSALDDVAEKLLFEFEKKDTLTRRRADALLSRIFETLSPPTKVSVLDFWRGRGGVGVGSRWLKAISQDKLLMDMNAIFEYWTENNDWRAAKIIAYQGDLQLLTRALPDFMARWVAGWIVGKTVLRMNEVSAETWMSIRMQYPATYAYLCAKLRRQIEPVDAVSILDEISRTEPDKTGLAVWAFGQLRLWDVLESVRAKA